MLTWIGRASRVSILRSGRCARSKTSRTASPPPRTKPAPANGSSPCRSAIRHTTSTYRRFSPKSDGQRAKISMPPPPTIPYSSARSGASGVTPYRWLPVPHTEALKRAGITRDTVSPVDVLMIEKDANGEPTGVFIEREMQPIAELIWFRQAAGFTRPHRARAMPMSAAAYHAFGTTSVFEEHGVANELLRAYKDAYRDGSLTMRSALVFSPNWKAVGEAPLGPLIEAWGGWLGEPALGDDWL